MKKINMAFAGFRHTHIYSLLGKARKNENINVCGAWEENETDKKNAEENYGVEFIYNTYEEILADKNIDAVAIGNYYKARGPMVISALKAGKHVFVDKPLCMKLEEVEEIIKLQKETGLSVFIMLDLRYHPNMLTAKKLIDAGEIGEINNISFNGQHPLSYKTRAKWYFEEGKHGGTINDIGIHGVDLLRYFTGSEVKDIMAARSWNKYAYNHPHFHDSGMFMLTMENGAGIMADVSYAAPDSAGYSLPFYWEFKIWGTEGVITFSVSTDGVTLYKNGNKEPVPVPKTVAEFDYTEDFVCEINGEATKYLSTEEVLKSSLATLKIQNAAL